MRRAALPLGLLADAVDAVNDGRFEWVEVQFKAEITGGRAQCLLHAIPRGRPVSVPNALLFEACARQSRPGAIQALLGMEAAAVDLGKRQVSQIQIVHSPRGTIFRCARSE